MLIWIIAAAAAYFVKGLCGFANTLMFTSILAVGSTANIDISPVDLLLGCPSNLIMTWKKRSRLDARIVLPLSGLILLGSIGGALLLKVVSVQRIKLMFGFVVIIVATDMWFREHLHDQSKMPNGIMVLIGLLSGFLCGLFGVGALLAAYVSRVTDDSETFKANISAVFSIENLFRLISYTALGIITASGIRQALFLLPVELAALYAGMACSRFLKEILVKRLIIILLILSGVMMILSNI